MFGCQQERCFVDNSTVHRWVCLQASVGKMFQERQGLSGCSSMASDLPTWLFLRRVVGTVTSPLLTDLWPFCQFSQSYGGLGFQGADPGCNRCMLPGSLQEGRRQSDWQTDGGKDRKKNDCVNNPSGCETWADVELKQSMTILFYSPLSTWAPEALCDVCVACLCACSAVRALRRAGEEMRDERGEQRRLWAEPSPRFIPACSVTPALWHVAALNRRAIIWCQVVQRPQTSVTALPPLRCICEPRQHAAVHCRFTSSFHNFIHSLFQQLSATSSCDKFASIVFASFMLTVRAGDWVAVFFWYWLKYVRSCMYLYLFILTFCTFESFSHLFKL